MLQRAVVLVPLRKRLQESNSPSSLRGMKGESSSAVWLDMKVPLSRPGMAHLKRRPILKLLNLTHGAKYFQDLNKKKWYR